MSSPTPRAAFADEGLKVSAAYVPSQEPSGRVIAQAQPAGTELERGATVQINVSTGPDPAAGVAVPNVTGRTLDEARQALEPPASRSSRSVRAATP